MRVKMGESQPTRERIALLTWVQLVCVFHFFETSLHLLVFCHRQHDQLKAVMSGLIAVAEVNVVSILEHDGHAWACVRLCRSRIHAKGNNESNSATRVSTANG